jgi:hypothetical protein
VKNTLVIVFNGGAYGTYLEWVLNTLMSNDAIIEPFTNLGNSHNTHLGILVDGINEFRSYITSDKQYLTIRMHPKTHSSHSVVDHLHQVLDHVPKLILLYPDRDHELLCVCNYTTKIWKGHIYDGAMRYMNPDDIFNNYPLSPDTDIHNIPEWIMREHMSFNLFSSWHDQVEWYLPDVWQHSNALIVTTKELFENFEQVLEKIINFWGVDPARPIADLVPSHKKMLSLQQHLGKDVLCRNIVDSVLGNAKPMTWNNLCKISQAWIQYQLRQRGYELLCHDLNNFPSDTASLKSVVVKSTIL